MTDPGPVGQGHLGDQQVGDGYSMPHVVAVGQVTLQGEGPLERVPFFSGLLGFEWVSWGLRRAGRGQGRPEAGVADP